MILSHEMRSGSEGGGGGERALRQDLNGLWQLSQYWSLPPSSLLAQVPTTIASKYDKNVTKDLKNSFLDIVLSPE